MIPPQLALVILLIAFPLSALLWAIESCRHVCPCTSDDECPHECTCEDE